jgi:rhodanese-related sulfurtransferase
MSSMQVVRMMGKQKEGYGNIKVFAGGVDAWERAGHRIIGDMWN